MSPPEPRNPFYLALLLVSLLFVMTALGYAARCHAAMGQQEKFRQRLDDIHKALAKMDESVRQQWDEWLNVVSRPVPAQ